MLQPKVPWFLLATVVFPRNCQSYIAMSLVLHMESKAAFFSLSFTIPPLCSLPNQLEWLGQCQDMILHWLSWQTPPVAFTGLLGWAICTTVVSMCFSSGLCLKNISSTLSSHTHWLYLCAGPEVTWFLTTSQPNLLVSGGSDVNCSS